MKLCRGIVDEKGQLLLNLNFKVSKGGCPKMLETIVDQQKGKSNFSSHLHLCGKVRYFYPRRILLRLIALLKFFA